MIAKKIAATLITAGFILMLGTAGASDLNTIPFSQIVYQVLGSLVMAGAGFAILAKGGYLNDN